MNRKITIVKYSILIINVLIYIYLLFIGRNQYLYNISYFKCILYMILTSLFIYISGLILKREKEYKFNIIVYIILYLLLLFSVTFCVGRESLKFYNWWYAGQYTPFNTIMSEFKYGSINSIIKNVLGNSVMLIPLSFLLMLKNLKYKNIFKQSIITLPIIIGIEILQAFTHTGYFDIDDIILNYFGTLIFTFLITRFKLVDKIRTLFFTDFNLSIKIKYIVFYFTLVLLIIFDIFLFIGNL